MAQRSEKSLSRYRRSIGIFGSLLSLLTSGCSSSGDTGTSTGTGTPDAGQPDGSTGDPTLLVGTFQVRSVPPIPAMGTTPAKPGATSVLGKVYDGVTPAQVVWEAGLKEGDCQLFTPRVPFCSTACGGSAVCVEDDTCLDYPIAHSAGQVTVSGLHTDPSQASFVMAPIADNYQPPAGVSLVYPGLDEGEAVTFAASGDYFSAFTLQAKGVSPLALLNDTILLGADQPLKLAWTPPGQAGISRIHVKLDISHHGGTKGMIECDADDTGSLELSAALVTKLLDLGVAGFPSVIVTRKAAGSVTIAPGRVDLIVSSIVEQGVQVSGLTSCSADTDCPNGQTCQTDLTCK